VGAVRRRAKVALVYQERGPAGAKRRLVAEGFLAGLVQHEMDHLDGVLFIDHTEPSALAFEEEWWSEVMPPLEKTLCSEGRCTFD